MTGAFRPLGDARLYRGLFVERPNRFLLRCRIPRHGTVDAFLPNPGRMEELLFPGLTPVVLTRVPPQVERRTRWTCVACDTPAGQPLFLDTHRTNDVAGYLIEQGRLPGLRGWRVEGREVRVGRSRFDFLLARGDRRLYLEVKSCTLFGGDGVAMFPDAVTERGRRHLQELAELAGQDVRPVVLFVVHSRRVRWFMPDYHTDLAFSRTFLDIHPRVRILPVAISWNADLSLGTETAPVRVPWAYLRREVDDRGAYLLLLRLDRERRVCVGSLGERRFAAGTHIYVGSAMANLTRRIERHLRRRKRLHWHVDYLRQVADGVQALPVRASRRCECDLAAGLGRLLRPSTDTFGCSDCGCATHLFHSPGDPLDEVAFHHFLQRHRMRAPA